MGILLVVCDKKQFFLLTSTMGGLEFPHDVSFAEFWAI